MLDGEMKWKVLAPMPKPNSHIESSWILWNNSIIITGGSTEKHPVTKRIILVGEVFRFHLDTLVCILLIFYITFFHSISILLLLDNLQTWSVVGKLPYRVKTTMTGFWDGCLYFTSGQRDRGPDNPQPGKVLGQMWRTRLS